MVSSSKSLGSAGGETGRGGALALLAVAALTIGGLAVYALFGDRPPSEKEDRDSGKVGNDPELGGGRPSSQVSQRPSEPASQARSNPDAVESGALAKLVASEELLLDLTQEIKGLSKSALNLQIPDHKSRALFAERIAVRGLAPSTSSSSGKKAKTIALGIEKVDWPLGNTTRQVSRNKLTLWSSFLSEVDFFDYAKFYFVRGKFGAEDRDAWNAELNFSGLARLKSGKWGAVKASQSVGFARSGKNGSERWMIDRWEQESFSLKKRDRLLFRETLADIVPSRSDFLRARTSLHEAKVLEFAVNPEFEAPIEFFSPVSVDRHPGVSVVDLDGDGFDDLYVMARWGKNLFFHNQGDGTFEERGATHGLDFEDHCSSAIFADFDNDGDPDLFLGRTLAPSLYLVNESGRFVDRSESWVRTDLPRLVSSVSAADYNGDGLLDVLFSTYAADLWQRQWMSFEALRTHPEEARKKVPESHRRDFEKKAYLGDHLSPEDSRELFRRSADGHVILARPGPPNLLLLNEGRGRFVVSPENEKLQIWHNTYQSTWGDSDGDGDPDLYVANDFAPNVYFRNDGGSLIDCTDPVTADIGFGMGASFGDYDNDGQQDLYVSNMFSKAGRRIAEQLPDLDPQIAAMARGNSLLKNRTEGFEKVSGMSENELHVEVGGWAWGGQFLDIDHDSYLDVYTLSGNYTPPRQVETFVDV